jgi:hypothetical protein
MVNDVKDTRITVMVFSPEHEITLILIIVFYSCKCNCVIFVKSDLTCMRLALETNKNMLLCLIQVENIQR